MQPSVPGVAAASLESDLTESQIRFIMNHQAVAGACADPFKELGGWPTAVIHLSIKLEQMDRLAAKIELAYQSLRMRHPDTVGLLCQAVYHPIARIVESICIFCPGVA